LVSVTVHVPGAVALSVNVAPEPVREATEPAPHVVVAVAGASAAAIESVSDAPCGKASLPRPSIALGDPVTDSETAPIGATGTLEPVPEQPAIHSDSSTTVALARRK
jgi:hypothetical protein